MPSRRRGEGAIFVGRKGRSITTQERWTDMELFVDNRGRDLASLLLESTNRLRDLFWKSPFEIPFFQNLIRKNSVSSSCAKDFTTYANLSIIPCGARPMRYAAGETAKDGVEVCILLRASTGKTGSVFIRQDGEERSMPTEPI